MANKLKLGIFGIGQFGLPHLKNWLQVKDVELVGFCDIDKLKQNLIQREFGIPYMPQSDLIDAADVIDVVTPTYAHYEIAREAVEKGRHAFVEKPFTQTLEEGIALRSLAEEKGVKVTVGFIERFNPVFMELSKQTDLKPEFIEVHRMGQFNPYRGIDIPVVHELMIHDLDMVQHLVNSDVRTIHASGTKVLSEEIDIVNARLEFENGCVANMTCSRIAPGKMRKTRIFQRNRYISLDMLNQKAEIYEIRENVDPESLDTERIMAKIPSQYNKGIAYRQIQSSSHNALKLEFESFIKSIVTNSEPPVTSTDAVRALDLAFRIKDRIIHGN